LLLDVEPPRATRPTASACCPCGTGRLPWPGTVGAGVAGHRWRVVLLENKSEAMAQSAWEGRRMREEGSTPEMWAQDRSAGRHQGVRGADTAEDDRAAPSRRARPLVQPLREALTAALRQRVLHRAARDQRAHPLLVGHICEQCLDAPALLVQPGDAEPQAG